MIKNYNYPIIISIQLLSNINIIVINIKFAQKFFHSCKKKKKLDETLSKTRINVPVPSNPEKGKVKF